MTINITIKCLENYDCHRLGRIWFIYGRDLDVTLLQKSAQSLTVQLVSRIHGSFLVTCVYASNFAAERENLWSELRYIHQLTYSSNIPWTIMGDFNEIFATAEHSRHMDYAIEQGGMRLFQNLVNDCGFHDLPQTGPIYTWWNHREQDPIGKKLDRVMVTDSWLDLFPQSYTNFAASGISDHALSVTFLTRETTSRRKPFRLFNHILDHPHFLTTVASYWGTTPALYHSRSALIRLQQKLKHLKPLLRQFNKEKYGDISLKVADAYKDLLDRQYAVLQDPTEDTLRAERIAGENWSHYASIEEQFYRKKSRINGLGCGDQNTAFFHQSVKARTAQNAILQLTRAYGTILTESSAIAAEAVDFFHTLLTATPRESSLAVDLSKILSYRCPNSVAESLVAPVTAEDILQILKVMPKNKAFGLDGYTS